MFELPLSSNNLRVSHPKFSISDLSQRDVFYSCGLTGYQRQRGREKKYRTLVVPLDALQRLPPGGSRGLWLPANVFPFRRPPLLPPQPYQPLRSVRQAAPSPGSTAQGGRQPRRLTHPPGRLLQHPELGRPLSCFRVGGSLVLSRWRRSGPG